ncbi:MAG: hypothetical protein FWF57_03300 [Defluviitaleaceae bacterium]|nr:hypothetical protein [Defluviitaleaceae bacterium]
MRITNVMIRNTMLGNINRNSNIANNLLTQVATGRRISSPSENPLMATRHIRLENSLNQINQHRRNVDHANSWTEVTEQAMRDLVNVKSRISELLTRVDAMETLSEQKIIANEILSLVDEKKEIMNKTFGGRYIFSGLRTNRPPFLVTDEPNKAVHDIQMDFTRADIETTFVMDRSQNFNNLFGNPPTLTNAGDWNESGFHATQIFRIRLPHNADLNSVSFNTTPTSTNVVTINNTTHRLPAPHEGQINFDLLRNGHPGNPNATPPIPATPAFPPDTIFHDPENGTLFTFDMQNFDDVLTNDRVTVTYNQTGFRQGDLNPLVYFSGNLFLGNLVNGQVPATTTPADWMAFSMENQDMNFEFGINARMPINLLAKNVVTANMFADIKSFANDILNSNLTDRGTVEARFRDYLTNNINNNPDFDTTTLPPQFVPGTPEHAEEVARRQAAREAALLGVPSEAVTLASHFLDREIQVMDTVIGDRFNNLIGRNENYSNHISHTHTDIGTRMMRLELIGDRLEEDGVTFESLSANNIGVDIGEVMMRINTAEVALRASMQAGMHQLMNLTLLNFL